MASTEQIIHVLHKHQNSFHQVVKFNPRTDKITQLDFTDSNSSLTKEVIENVEIFSDYINAQLKENSSLFGIGGYGEHRTVYSRSKVFDADKHGEEPRRLHLGTDIWGNEGTAVYAALGGMVHSFAFNNRYGDYGATIILLHQLDGIPFYTLYGHLSLSDIEKLKEGNYISHGQVIGHFGRAEENGHWPPHLHFQIINEIRVSKGDYPGVCKFSEKEMYLNNCPDPDLILQLNKYL
ncbi:MAG: peptidoglycan DD-metalloendopeptidase family protein [Sphingobacteriales bacterium]|nr:peptidoglycan DD-metalloendopeptidase family protein [Sphingobacteriales bacterium]